MVDVQLRVESCSCCGCLQALDYIPSTITCQAQCPMQVQDQEMPCVANIHITSFGLGVCAYRPNSRYSRKRIIPFQSSGASGGSLQGVQVLSRQDSFCCMKKGSGEPQKRRNIVASARAPECQPEIFLIYFDVFQLWRHLPQWQIQIADVTTGSPKSSHSKNVRPCAADTLLKPNQTHHLGSATLSQPKLSRNEGASLFESTLFPFIVIN